MGYLKQLGEIAIPFESWEEINKIPFFRLINQSLVILNLI